EAAAREFNDTEQMLVAVESVYGPYRWDRYDVLIMPPALPFGGVENPRLTFMSPTILAGDKSLLYALAHEIAHSLSGNLVNHLTWPDLWLNEGFTTYIEWRVLEQLHGKDRADMQRTLAIHELQEARATLSLPNDRRLIPTLNGRDPDDAYSAVPYFQG